MKRIETTYEILKISLDGLVKSPKERGYGGDEDVFYGPYQSMSDVDEAIIKYGSEYESYIVLTSKRIVDTDQ